MRAGIVRTMMCIDEGMKSAREDVCEGCDYQSLRGTCILSIS